MSSGLTHGKFYIRDVMPGSFLRGGQTGGDLAEVESAAPWSRVQNWTGSRAMLLGQKYSGRAPLGAVAPLQPSSSSSSSRHSRKTVSHAIVATSAELRVWLPWVSDRGDWAPTPVIAGCSNRMSRLALKRHEITERNSMRVCDTSGK
jgi:hypothetical protein